MRTFLKILVVILLALVGILLWNTYQMTTRQLTGISPAPAVPAGDSALVHLSRAIQFKTISYPDHSKTDTTEFAAFVSFLEKTYPLVHTRLVRERINHYALLYQWPGTDPSLKPLLLLGHYDVVPVIEGTESMWARDPFSGAIQDEFIYGRGSLDDKSTVLGILEGVEYLLGQNFRPERTLYLAFGHDEEVSGLRGAQAIARTLKKRGIRFEMVLDEGGTIKTDGVAGLKQPVALVGIAEKGHISLRLTARGEGGHSSMPPKKTSIGLLASALERLQRKPFEATLKGPVGQMLRYLGPEMPFGQRLAIANQWLFGPILIREFSKTPSGMASLHTTIAPTIFKAGVKDNVLPIDATAVVNLRILSGDSLRGVIDYVRKAIDNPDIEIESLGEFDAEPSVVSPPDAAAFQQLHQTIKSCYPGVLVAPYLMLGATDARHYQPLSENVYRFTPFQLDEEDLKRSHGTNERIRTDTYLEMIRFYATLIKNAAQ
jgi:carboxypeptidase PM20D1